MDRYSEETSRRERDIPSFLEQPPPLIQNPFMIPRPEKGINLMERFEESSDSEETELVQVYLRLRPCREPSNVYEIRSDKCLVTSLDTATAGHGRRTQHNVSKMYSFTKIFTAECSQKEIFERVVKDNLKKLIYGYSFTLLTYGASGSGKTYTVMGTVNSPGLVPRSLEYIFKLVDAAQTPVYKPSDNGTDQLGYGQQDFELQWVKQLRQLSAPIRDKYRRMSKQLHGDITVSNVDLTNRTKYYVWVSFVEIYNENIYDLLAPADKRAKLRIREDSSGNVYVKGVTQAFVRSGEEAYDVLVAGKHNLVVAATGVHAQSSRSHCIFTITMLTEKDGEIRSSQVRLCDLAGCERQQAARNTGARMKESRSINSSLHVLERCLHMLRKKQRMVKDTSMVPYRESKLTRLLGGGLSGARGEAVSMVVTLNPAPQHAALAKHVLSLATVAKDIQVNTTMAMTMTSSLESTQDSTLYTSDEVMRLRAENERLHFELLQAESCITKLRASIDVKQQENANMMREIVEETRDSMRQYYENRLAAVQAQKNDMEEEYEAKLAEQDELIAKLMREVKERKEYFIKQYLLESKKPNDIIAEDEIRDEPPSTYLQTNHVSSDSEDETENTDSGDESLEPVNWQNMKNINPTRLSLVFRKDSPQKQPVIDLESDCSDIEEENEEIDTPNNRNVEHDKSDVVNDKSGVVNDKSDIVNDKSYVVNDKSYVVKDKSDVVNDKSGGANDSANDELRVNVQNENSNEAQSSKDSLYATGDEDSDTEQKIRDAQRLASNITNTTFDNIKIKDSYAEHSRIVSELDRSECEKTFQLSTKMQNSQSIATAEDSKAIINSASNTRGTYFVNDSEDSSGNVMREDIHEMKAINNLRGTYFVAERDVSSLVQVNITDESIKSAQAKKQRTSQISEERDCKSPPNKNQSPQLAESPPKYIKPKTAYVNKIIKSLKTRQSSNSSLNQFEQLERAMRDENSPETNTNSTFITNTQLPALNEKKTYFDDSMRVEVSNSTTDDTALGDKKASNKSKYFEESPELHKPLVCSGKLCVLSSAAKMQQSKLINKTSDEMTGPEHEMEKKRNDNKTSPTPKLPTKLYFDETDRVIQKDILLSKSPSLVRDEVCQNYEPSVAVKKILSQNFAKPELPTKHVHKKNASVDMFESPLVNLSKEKPNAPVDGDVDIDNFTNKNAENDLNTLFPNVKPKALEIARKFVEAVVVESQYNKDMDIKDEEVSLEKTTFTQESRTDLDNRNSDSADSYANMIDGIKVELPSIKMEPVLNDTQASNNTVDEFEKIVKASTNVRPTEFDLLFKETENVLDPNADNKATETQSQKEHTAENIAIYSKKQIEQTEISEKTKKFEEVKYNLRNKGKSIHLNTSNESRDTVTTDTEKCKMTKRSLRLRRRQNQNDVEESDSHIKLKDILNLEKEFSDVTLGVPAVKKVVNDIPSPEKAGDEENLPLMMGIQSCPSKSVTRSRRKLFTPRAEPLEESPDGDSNERVRVPRPSYHRARARRKL